MEKNKALHLLGIARKANRLAIGEEPAGIACRSGKARLLLVAQDAGEHTVRRAQSFCRSGKPADNLPSVPSLSAVSPCLRLVFLCLKCLLKHILRKLSDRIQQLFRLRYPPFAHRYTASFLSHVRSSLRIRPSTDFTVPSRMSCLSAISRICIK